jgi:exosome complex component MTR3
VLETDGPASSLASAMTCASLALADAGIDMKDSVTGVSVGMQNSSGRVVVDCTEKEESGEEGGGSVDGMLVVGMMPSLNEVTHIVQTGAINMNLSMEV